MNNISQPLCEIQTFTLSYEDGVGHTATYLVSGMAHRYAQTLIHLFGSVRFFFCSRFFGSVTVIACAFIVYVIYDFTPAASIFSRLQNARTTHTQTHTQPTPTNRTDGYVSNKS